MKTKLDDIYPLSAPQQGMLLKSLAAPGQGIHIEQLSGRLRGGLDVEAFRRSWQRAVERHPILRTAFVWKDQKEPLQIVLRNAELPFSLEDLRGLESVEQRSRVEAYGRADLLTGFVLSRPPLMRLKLFRLGDELYQFVWTHHHILMDGWCRPLLLEEVISTYHALAAGRDLRLRPCPAYGEYIDWLRRQDPLASKGFWTEALRGFRHPTPLGRSATPRTLAPGEERFAAQWGALSAGETDALRQWAQRSRLTLGTLAQGMWGLLLSAYSGGPDVAFGVTVAGRPPELEGIESTIGLFIRTLPLRLRLSPGERVEAWLAGVQSLGLELRQHEQTPGAEIRRWSEIPASQPLYESLLVYENYPGLKPAASEERSSVEIEEIQAQGARTRHAATLVVRPEPELSLQVIHDRLRLGD